MERGNGDAARPTYKMRRICRIFGVDDEVYTRPRLLWLSTRGYFLSAEGPACLSVWRYVCTFWIWVDAGIMGFEVLLQVEGRWANAKEVRHVSRGSHGVSVVNLDSFNVSEVPRNQTRWEGVLFIYIRACGRGHLLSVAVGIRCAPRGHQLDHPTAAVCCSLEWCLLSDDDCGIIDTFSNTLSPSILYHSSLVLSGLSATDINSLETAVRDKSDEERRGVFVQGSLLVLLSCPRRTWFSAWRCYILLNTGTAKQPPGNLHTCVGHKLFRQGAHAQRGRLTHGVHAPRPI